MKPVILVIGINDNTLLKNAYLSSSGINTEYEYVLIHKLIGEFENSEDANKAFQGNVNNYEYLEIKTVYKKS